MQRIITKDGIEMLSNIRGVIFQLSGTLIDPGCAAPFHAMNYALSHSGLAITNQFLNDKGGRSRIFPTSKKFVADLLAHPTMLGQWECIYNYNPRPFDIDRIWNDYKHELEYIAPKYATPTPFAVDLFAALRNRGIKIGITTHYSIPVVESILDKLFNSGLVFDNIVCGDDGDTMTDNESSNVPIFKILKDWRLSNYEPSHILNIGSTSDDIIRARTAYVMSCQVIDTSNEMGNNIHVSSNQNFNDMNRELMNFRRSETKAKFEVLGADYYCYKLNDVIGALSIC